MSNDGIGGPRNGAPSDRRSDDRALPGGPLLEAMLRKRGIRAEAAAALTRLALPALRFRVKRTPGISPAGVSRTGGEPDLPPEMPWPLAEGMPLAFVAQIDLEEAARCASVIPELPRRGHVAVFHDCLRCTDGFYPNYEKFFRVAYFDAPLSSLRRCSIPEELPESARFPERVLTPFATMSLPDTFEPSVEALALAPHEVDAYDAVKDEFGLGGDFVPDQVGGWPSQVQNGPFADAGDPRPELVLQVGSEAFARDGDFEALYVCASRNDIAAARFDRFWCLFETA